MMSRDALARSVRQRAMALHASLMMLLLGTPQLASAAQEGIQANPKRWLLVFPVLVVVIIVVLIRKTRRK
jgi:hypothetical protein